MTLSDKLVEAMVNNDDDAFYSTLSHESVNCYTSDYRYPLVVSIVCKYEYFTEILALCDNVNLASDSMTAIQVAAMTHRFDYVETLVQHGADVSQVVHSMIPVSPVSESYVDLLIAHGLDLNILDEEGMSLLFRSELEDQPEAARKLRDAGERLTDCEELLVAVHNLDMKRIEKFVDKGVDVNCVTSYVGHTPFSYACGHDTAPLSLHEYFIDAEALVNFPTVPPVFSAAERGRADVIRLLHEHGCDLDAINLTGERVYETCLLFDHLESFEMLLTCGASVPWDYQLIYAAQKNDLQLVQHCLDNGADPNFQGRESFPQTRPLISAVKFESLDVIPILTRVSSTQTINDAIEIARERHERELIQLIQNSRADD